MFFLLKIIRAASQVVAEIVSRMAMSDVGKVLSVRI